MKNNRVYGDFSLIYDRLMEDFDYKGWYEELSTILSPWNKSINTCLEIGCGTGELSKYLADDYILDAVDLSEDMIKIAKNKGIKANWICEDVRKIVGKGKYDLIVFTSDVIHYIKPSERVEVLIKLREMLSSKGQIIFDARCLEIMQELDSAMFQVDEEDLFAVYTYEISDMKNLEIEVQAFFLKEEWIRIKENHKLYLESSEGWKDIITKANLKIVSQSKFLTSKEGLEESLRTMYLLER
ncbi:MAG: class I SAM-dependent methyltransferase [Tissierellia bacterium]|nr:class I SAM-dependent methyltransferase [Tissierellia bacterium]